MISWRKYSFSGVPSPITASNLGDGSTSGVWNGLDINMTSATSTLTVGLPTVANSMGRLFAFTVTNPSTIEIQVVPSGSEVIYDTAVEKTLLSTVVDNTVIVIFSDGSRWNVVANDGNWT